MIYCGYPHAQYKAHQKDIDSAVARVLDSGRYVLGAEIEAFEREFSSYLGVSYAIGLNSGTDALFLSLKSVGVGEGDEVVVPSHTAVPTVAAIGMAGATPVFVDIEKNYYTVNPKAVESAITKRTKVIVAVHLYGQPANLEALAEIADRRHVTLIEDCAQSTGAQWDDSFAGGIGLIGCFSFFPTKNLAAMGDGGCVVTNDPAIAQCLYALRQYGWDQHRVSCVQGYNSRLDELQAAVLRAKLPYLEGDNNQRIQLADRYDFALQHLPIQLPRRRPNCSHVFHLYVIETEYREDLRLHLLERDIVAGIHYQPATHQMPAYQSFAEGECNLPITESVVDRILSLPLYPGMTTAEQSSVIDAVREFYSK